MATQFSPRPLRDVPLLCSTPFFFFFEKGKLTGAIISAKQKQDLQQLILTAE